MRKTELFFCFSAENKKYKLKLLKLNLKNVKILWPLQKPWKT
jgi:hypothetical protein